MSKYRFGCLLLALWLLFGSAMASPGLDGFHCTLAPSLSASGILAEPFDRWAGELFALMRPEIQYAQWPEGQALQMALFVGERRALQMELAAGGEWIAMRSSLMGEGWVLLTGDAALDALRLMDGVSTQLEPEGEWALSDCTLSMHAERLAQRLREGAGVLSRWEQGADPAHEESTRALSAALKSAADLLGTAPEGAPVLSVFVHYLPLDMVPTQVDSDWPAAPEALPAALASSLPELLLRSVAEAGDSQKPLD